MQFEPDNEILSPSEFGTALYYPYIDIRDFGWLKSALLFWDRVRRIVPEGWTPRSNWQVNEFVDRGVLINTDPSSYKANAETRFRQSVMPYIQNRETVPENSPVQLWRSRIRAEPDLTKSYQIHVRKMSEELATELESQKLARIRGEWINLHPTLAGLYMTCLATEIGKQTGAPPVTDRPEFSFSGDVIGLKKSQVRSPEQLSQLLLQLNIKFPGPNDVAHIPDSVILEFNEKYKNERKRFRDVIQKTLIEASSIEDKNMLTDFFSDKRVHITEAVNDYHRTFDELKLQTALGVLNLKVPAAILGAGAVISPFDHVIAGVVGAVGVGLAALGWRAQSRSQWRVVTKNPWHYALLLEKEFPTT